VVSWAHPDKINGESTDLATRFLRQSQSGEAEMTERSEVHRAPNEKFYAIWRGQAICAIAGVLLYFESEREAKEFIRQCDAENRIVEFA